MEQQNEDDKIKEYMQRSDTAVIFPEPVENEGAKNKPQEKEKTDSDAKNDQKSMDVDNKASTALENDKKHVPENDSSNHSKILLLFVVMHLGF